MREVKVIILSCIAMVSAVAQGGYSADWESLSGRSCPQWWKDAKFGIFVHWGVYSVPAFAPTSGEKFYACYAEHYRGRLLKGETAFVEHHNKFYPHMSYEDFAPAFSAQNWRPNEWAILFKRSGAKYVVLTSKHHDGFALWPSAESPYWNSVVLGPKRDVCGELTKAVREVGLHMGLYYSLFEYVHPLCETNTMDQFVDRVNIPQLKDLVLRYLPEIIWTDGHWKGSLRTFRGAEFLSWLYSESPVRNTVVVNDRWGKESRGKVGDFYTTEYDEGGNVARGAKHSWEECRGIGRSFGYNRFERVENYLTDAQCIEMLCDKVSRGGNFLLNIGPDATGLIPPIMEERLLAMGRWLAVNGEAIYGTTAWDGHPKDMKKDHIYYTNKLDALYAIVFNWPQGRIRVSGCGGISKVTLLGSDESVLFAQDGNDLVITPPTITPGTMPCQHAWAFKIVRQRSAVL